MMLQKVQKCPPSLPTYLSWEKFGMSMDMEFPFNLRDLKVNTKSF